MSWCHLSSNACFLVNPRSHYQSTYSAPCCLFMFCHSQSNMAVNPSSIRISLCLLLFSSIHAHQLADDGARGWHWTSHVEKYNKNQDEKIGTTKYRLPKNRFDTIDQAISYAKMLLRESSKDIDGEIEDLVNGAFQKSNQPMAKSVRARCPETAEDSRTLIEAWQRFRRNARDDSERCLLCTDVMGILQTLVCNADYENAVSGLIRICEILLEAADSKPAMCNGTITLQAPYIFTTLMEATTYDFCESLNVCLQPPSPNTASVSQRISRIMAQRDSEQPVRSTEFNRGDTQNYIKLIQLADIHMSQKYIEGSAVDCNLYVCCLEESEGQGSARMYGEHSCNIPERTMNHFLDKVAEMDPDLIIFSGDAPPHTIWDETFQSQLNCTSTVVRALKERLPGKTIYPNIGNHETFPTNIYATRVNYTVAMNNALVYLWRDLAGFGPEQEETMSHLGYYSIGAASYGGLRILSLNTNHYWYTLNFVCTLNRNTTDEQVHREFILESLAKARTNDEKVIVIGHHPVGGVDSIVRATRWWEEVSLEYNDVIIMLISGHTHNDEFHLFLDPVTSEAKGINYVAPPMTSNTDVNPSIRVFYLDNSTYELMNIENYYMELDDQQPGIPPPIVKTYDARESYNLPNLSPASWKELTIRFVLDEAQFQAWHNNRDAKAMYKKCTDECRIREICRMWFPNYDEIEECVDVITSPPGPPATTPLVPETTGHTGSAGSPNVRTLLVCVTILFSVYH